MEKGISIALTQTPCNQPLAAIAFLRTQVQSGHNDGTGSHGATPAIRPWGTSLHWLQGFFGSVLHCACTRDVVADRLHRGLMCVCWFVGIHPRRGFSLSHFCNCCLGVCYAEKATEVWQHTRPRTSQNIAQAKELVLPNSPREARFLYTIQTN